MLLLFPITTGSSRRQHSLTRPILKFVVDLIGLDGLPIHRYGVLSQWLLLLVLLMLMAFLGGCCGSNGRCGHRSLPRLDAHGLHDTVEEIRIRCHDCGRLDGTCVSSTRCLGETFR